jgi:hypothetical protein
MYQDEKEKDFTKVQSDNAINYILSLLKNAGRPLSTREVQQETEKNLIRCPDSTIVFLNKLRLKGFIKGKRSKEKHGWIWWIEN